MTTRVYNRYQNSSFSAGQGFETVETREYVADIDDDLARHLLKAFPQFFRREPWPEGLVITDEAVMAAVNQAEGDPDYEGASMSDNSITMGDRPSESNDTDPADEE